MSNVLLFIKDQLNEKRKARIRQDRIVAIALGVGFAICAITGTTRKGLVVLGIGFTIGSFHSLALWAMTT